MQPISSQDSQPPHPQADIITWLDVSAVTLGQGKPYELVMTEGSGIVDPLVDNPVSFSQALTRIDALIATNQVLPTDTKCRFDGLTWQATQEGGVRVEIRIGPTHYQECVLDIEDTNSVAQRARLGQDRHNDPRRYLACGIGVLILPTTPHGQVLMGLRNGSYYQNCLHAPTGWLPFDANVARVDPAAHTLVECEEEFGLTGLVKPTLLAVVSYPDTYETEIIFTATAPEGVLEDLVMHQTWKTAIDAQEHSDVFLVEPSKVLEDNSHRIVPSSLFGLMTLSRYLASKDFW